MINRIGNDVVTYNGYWLNFGADPGPTPPGPTPSHYNYYIVKVVGLNEDTYYQNGGSYYIAQFKLNNIAPTEEQFKGIGDEWSNSAHTVMTLDDSTSTYEKAVTNAVGQYIDNWYTNKHTDNSGDVLIVCEPVNDASHNFFGWTHQIYNTSVNTGNAVLTVEVYGANTIVEGSGTNTIDMSNATLITSREVNCAYTTDRTRWTGAYVSWDFPS